jgi:hypothetical protein
MAFGYSDKNKKSRLLFKFFFIGIGISFIVYGGMISFLQEFTTILIILIFLRIARIFILNLRIISIASVRIRKSINIFSISTISIAISIFDLKIFTMWISAIISIRKKRFSYLLINVERYNHIFVNTIKIISDSA